MVEVLSSSSSTHSLPPTLCGKNHNSTVIVVIKRKLSKAISGRLFVILLFFKLYVVCIWMATSTSQFSSILFASEKKLGSEFFFYFLEIQGYGFQYMDFPPILQVLARCSAEIFGLFDFTGNCFSFHKYFVGFCSVLLLLSNLQSIRRGRFF